MNVEKIKLRLLCFLVVFMLFGATCAFGATPDVKTFPSQTGVDLNHHWTIKFSDYVDPGSENLDLIRVINNRNGERVANPQPQVLSDGKSVQLAPPADGYEPNTNYTILVEGVKSRSNVFLEQSAIKKFTTKASGQLVDLGQEKKVINNPFVANTVSYQGKAVVEIPANTVGGGAEVTIKEVSGAERHQFSDLESLATYDISINANFTNDLTLRFKYEPTALAQAHTPADQLVVAYYDTDHQRWVETDFTVDTNSEELVVTTNHLSLWSIFGLGDDMAVITEPDFQIYYNKNLNAPKLAGAPEDLSLGRDYLSQFVAHTRKALMDSYTKYGNNGFKLPKANKVYINDWGAEATANWGWFSKNIEIPIQYHDYTELRHESAHELFHAVQNQYLSFPSMVLNRWWVEATADYAAAEIMGAKKFTPMSEAYLRNTMGRTDGALEYQSARFIDYLVRYQGIDFKQLWQYTVDNWSRDMLPVIDSFMRQEKDISMAQCYRDFARYLIFSSEIRQLSGSDTWRTPYEMSEQIERPLEIRLSNHLTIGMFPYTVNLWGFKPEIAPDAPSRSLILELHEDLPAGVFADVFVLYDHQWHTGLPVPTATLQSSADPVVVTVGRGQMLFVLVSNSTNGNTSMGFNVKELDFTVDPDKLEAQYGVRYPFAVGAKNIPGNHRFVKFVWDFGDGETEDEANLSQGEQIGSVSSGQANITIYHKYMKQGVYYLQLKMLDMNDKLMSNAMAVVTVPNEDTTVDIWPAGTLIYELKDEATPVYQEFWFTATPPGTYRFDVDYGDGSPVESYTGKESIASHHYRKTGAFWPTVTLYSLDGTRLSQDSMTIIIEMYQEEPDEVVNIPDRALEDLVRKNLNKPGGDLLKSDMEKLRELDATDSNYNIRNITGLEYAVNLEKLDLSLNDITNISPLAPLTKLKWLSLVPQYDNWKHYIDLSPLAGLKNLETLWLLYYKYDDITPLEGMKMMRQLRLQGDDGFGLSHGLVSDITPLAEMVNLEDLSLDGNNISDITPLSELKKLVSLRLDSNRINHIGALSDLTNLESLHISRNNISDISPLQRLTKLDDLSADKNDIVDINSLSTLTNLNALNLSENKIKNIDAMSSLTKLKYLGVEKNQITNIDVLKKLPALKNVVVLNNEYLNFNPGTHAAAVISWLKENNCSVY